MNPENRTWQPIDPAAGSLPEGIESALGDGDSVSACVVVLVDSELDREWSAQASLAVAKRWAASGRRVILADACLDRPVLHEAAGVENGEGVSDMVLYGASVQRIAGPVGDGLFLAPAGTPVVQVADVLTHIKWDTVIRGCRDARATLVFHVSTGTPGAWALTERADGVLVLAPSSQDVDAIVGSKSGPLIAVLGPGNGGDPSAADLPGPAVADPEEEAFGADEPPAPAFAEPGGGDFSLDALPEPDSSEGEEDESDAFSIEGLLSLPDEDEEDALAVEGLLGLPEEEAPPGFSFDDLPELLETDVAEAGAIVLEAEESTEPFGTAVGGDVGVGTPDLDSGVDLEIETSVDEDTDDEAEHEDSAEGETPFSQADNIEFGAALETGEEAVAGAAETSLDLGGFETAAGFDLEDALADLEETPDQAPLEIESTTFVDDEGGDEVDVESPRGLAEPVPVSDSPAEVGAEASLTEDALAGEGLLGLPEEEAPPGFSVDDLPELPSTEGEEGETSDAFSMTSLEGSQYDGTDSPDAGLETDVADAGAIVSEAEEYTEPFGTAVGGDVGVGTPDLGAALETDEEAIAGAAETSLDMEGLETGAGLDLEDAPADLEDAPADLEETPDQAPLEIEPTTFVDDEGGDGVDVESPVGLAEPVPVSDSPAEVGAEASPTEDALVGEGLPGLAEEAPPRGFSVDDLPELPETDLVEAGAIVSEAEEYTEASGTAVGGDVGVGTPDLDSGADLEVETSVDEDTDGDAEHEDSAEGETPLSQADDMEVGAALETDDEAVAGAAETSLGMEGVETGAGLDLEDAPADLEETPDQAPLEIESTTFVDDDGGDGVDVESASTVVAEGGDYGVVDRGVADTKAVTTRVRTTEWRVVLAEDDDDYALVVEQSLEKAAGGPVEIRRARTGDEGLALLREFLPDLLILDLKMPGMSGHEALEEIKGDPALISVPVAVLTSSDRDEDAAKSYGLGGNHFITKPSDPAELEAKLRALLRNLKELRGIRRGAGASTTAVSAVDPDSMVAQTVLRWVVVVAVLLALYFFGSVSGVF